MGPTGPSGKNPSTAASTNQTDNLYSSRGFGELGSTKKKEELKKKLAADQESNLPHFDASSSDDDDDVKHKQDGPTEEPKSISCPNCQQEIKMEEAAAHTVLCYRNSTKCKVCSKVILKSKKKEHLDQWRDPEMLKQAIKDDHEEQVSLHFDHGMDVNMQFSPVPKDTS